MGFDGDNEINLVHIILVVILLIKTPNIQNHSRNRNLKLCKLIFATVAIKVCIYACRSCTKNCIMLYLMANTATIIAC